MVEEAPQRRDRGRADDRIRTTTAPGEGRPDRARLPVDPGCRAAVPAADVRLGPRRQHDAADGPRPARAGGLVHHEPRASHPARCRSVELLLRRTAALHRSGHVLPTHGEARHRRHGDLGLGRLVVRRGVRHVAHRYGVPADRCPGRSRAVPVDRTLGLAYGRPTTTADVAPGIASSAAATGPLGSGAPLFAWSGFWALSAVLWLFPDNRASGAIGAQLNAAASGQPSWYAHFQTSVANALPHSGSALAWLLAGAVAGDRGGTAAEPPAPSVSVRRGRAPGPVLDHRHGLRRHLDRNGDGPQHGTVGGAARLRHGADAACGAGQCAGPRLHPAASGCRRHDLGGGAGRARHQLDLPDRGCVGVRLGQRFAVRWLGDGRHGDGGRGPRAPLTPRRGIWTCPG